MTTEPGEIDGMSYAEAQQAEQDDQPLDPRDWAHGPFSAMPRSSQADMDAKLRNALSEAFGPDAVSQVAAVDMNAPAFSVGELLIIDSALRIAAAMLIVGPDNEKEMAELVQAELHKLGNTIDVETGTPALVSTILPSMARVMQARFLETIGKRILATSRKMLDGKSAGLFEAPF